MTSTSADFIIIGGGIAGASAGYELSKVGRVILLEKENRPGYHTTGRSAAIFTKSYRDGDPLINALVVASEAFFKTPPAGFTDHPLISPRAMIHIASKDKTAALDGLHEKLKRINVASRFLSRNEARALLPILAENYQEKVLFEEEIYDMDVSALHEGFLQGIKAAGQDIISTAEVTGLHSSGGLWTVTTPQGVYRAPVVINAAGAWVDEVAALADIAPIDIHPLRRTMIMVSAPDNMDPRDWPFVMEATQGFYFRPDSGKLIATPADEHLSPPCDAQPEEIDIAYAAHYLQETTTLEVRKIDTSWAGLRNHVADGYPVVGFDPAAPGFFWLAGQGGFGIKTAPALGRITAALVQGKGLPDDVSRLGLTEAQISVRRLKR
ncbi:NAD(P)/FAD-dependent oxidoreductase [Paremcibacter congregatus]|uniref:FAD-dependent oxidoreductase n=1 Tax=Paremcibacter congregatus TaxID=2043170 RepID=A0A2G4YP10_9PROT|nr:FAD-binding oxidoreductase [Paremcibacter congregatus]PHZ84059.1 FAD-dependent oxidoreductase [Paremcibacter congregatus]QDE25880.1 FAD-binding oxidoreductase [Paremcibacter congregatus]